MTPNNPGGWPDATRPGVPLNPDKDGWHWLEWMDYCGTKPSGLIEQFKWERDGFWDRTTHRSARYWHCWRYAGPCLTPAEIAAQVAAARAEERDAICALLDLYSDDDSEEHGCVHVGRMKAVIRARGTP